MDHEHVIKNGEISVDLVEYMKIFRLFGQISFELTKEENRELLIIVRDFKEIEKQEPGFDMKAWIEANMDFSVSDKAFAVFSFVITQWNPSTIFNNSEHSSSDFIYFNVINEGFAH
ncbi:MAG: hypothetical protein JXR18_14585 [Neptuniibacter sp.]